MREHLELQNLDDPQEKKPRFSTVLNLAKELTPTLQFRLITRLLPNLNFNQIKELEDNLPFWATEVKKKQEAQKEEKKKKLLQALTRTNSFIEERPVIEELKKSGQEKQYYYLFVRWRDPNKKTLVGISISSEDLQDPLIRELAEKKLGRPINI